MLRQDAATYIAGFVSRPGESVALFRVCGDFARRNYSVVALRQTIRRRLTWIRGANLTPSDPSRRRKGAPGSGKSTLAELVASSLRSRGVRSTALGMDGYHLTRAQLDASEDPAAMHQRRGAHWTFDARGFVDAARRLKPAAGRELRWPGFDHGVGDPEPDKLCVEADCEVVIVEGNYLLLDEPVWAELGEDVFIERWFVRVDVDEAMRRVCARHIETGKSAVVAAARTGAGGSDRLNAELINSARVEPDVVVVSRPFR